VVAYFSIVFTVDLQFWLDNRVELAHELRESILAQISPYFQEMQLGETSVVPGSVVAYVPWLNVPGIVNVNPSLLDNFLPSGCFNFPSQYLLSQLEQSQCSVSLNRLCSSGEILDWADSCPTPAPTEAPYMGQNVNAAFNATQASVKDYALIIGLIGAILLFSLFLCCLLQYRRNNRIDKAMKSLKDQQLKESMWDSFAHSQGSLSQSLSQSLSSFSQSDEHHLGTNSKDYAPDESVQPLSGSHAAEWDNLFRDEGNTQASKSTAAMSNSAVTVLDETQMESVWSADPSRAQSDQRSFHELPPKSTKPAVILDLDQVWGSTDKDKDSDSFLLESSPLDASGSLEVD